VKAAPEVENGQKRHYTVIGPIPGNLPCQAMNPQKNATKGVAF